jgi:hypothetical protein
MQFPRIGPALCLALLLMAVPVRAQSPGGSPPEEAMREYEAKLADYTKARQEFDEQNRKYWGLVAEKRRIRNDKRSRQERVVAVDYVLEQPPVYSGPPRPIDPSAPPLPPQAPPVYSRPPRPVGPSAPPLPPQATPVPRSIPVVADFLKAAAEHFDFVPQQPKTEIEYKKAYARTAFAAGLTKDQVVRIYAFESGGSGRYDVQAGLEYPKPDAKAVSTALGYNQLLTTNSVELMAEKGDQFIKALQVRSSTLSGARKTALEHKIVVVSKMVEVSRHVPDTWSEHEKLGATPQGLGIHATNLDVDVGPLLQTQKLLDSVVFARRKGHVRPLTAAELEMMNLTGDGNGYDVLTMPRALREQIPTANLFQQTGYERNSIANRNNTVSKLVAAIDRKMNEEVKLPGAKEMASAYRHLAEE